MNPLNSTTNKWIGDGSDGNVSVDGTEVSFGSNKRGTPFNIRLDDDALSPSDSFFYEVELVELNGTIGVGAITKDEFLPGWKSKGMFYNGNLTNGSAALLTGFGKFAAAGDIVGVYLKRDGDKIKTFFYFNGSCLGEAFQLDGKGEVFYPCLHLDGNALVKFRTPDAFPSETNREPSQRADKYCGDWELIKAFDGPELGERPLPSVQKIILSFDLAGKKSYRLSVKVGNTMNTTVDITGKVETFDEIKVGMVASTRKMPPPEVYAFENFLSSSLPKMHRMIVSENKELIISGPASELISKMYEKKFEPLTKY